jgi:hypothetical protein
VKVPMEAPELLAAAAGPSTEEKGAEQFGSQEQPFEWGDKQIWPGVTLDEIRCSPARRVRKPRLAFQQN